LGGGDILNLYVICPQRQRLLVNYRDTTHRYSEAVRDLVEMVGLGVAADFDLLRRNCRRTLDTAEQARLALNRHEADHFCDRDDFIPDSHRSN